MQFSHDGSNKVQDGIQYTIVCHRSKAVITYDIQNSATGKTYAVHVDNSKELKGD